MSEATDAAFEVLRRGISEVFREGGIKFPALGDLTEERTGEYYAAALAGFVQNMIRAEIQESRRSKDEGSEE